MELSTNSPLRKSIPLSPDLTVPQWNLSLLRRYMSSSWGQTTGGSEHISTLPQQLSLPEFEHVGAMVRKKVESSGNEWIGPVDTAGNILGELKEGSNCEASVTLGELVNQHHPVFAVIHGHPLGLDNLTSFIGDIGFMETQTFIKLELIATKGEATVILQPMDFFPVISDPETAERDYQALVAKLNGEKSVDPEIAKLIAAKSVIVGSDIALYTGKSFADLNKVELSAKEKELVESIIGK